MTFKVIETQEQLDQIIKDRVERAKESAKKEAEAKYADYEELKAKVEKATAQDTEKDKRLTELEELVKGQKAEAENLTAKIHGLESEKTKAEIAHAVGLPYEMASRLKGDTEEALREDAEALKGLMGNKTAPLAGYDNQDAEPDRKSELRSMLNSMKK